MIRLLLLIFLALLIVGALPVWPYSVGWPAYYSGGGIGFLIVVIIIVFLVL